MQAMSNEEVRARLVVVVCGMIASDKFPSSERVRRLRSLLKNLDPSFEATELPLWLKRTRSCTHKGDSAFGVDVIQAPKLEGSLGWRGLT